MGNFRLLSRHSVVVSHYAFCHPCSVFTDIFADYGLQEEVFGYFERFGALGGEDLRLVLGLDSVSYSDGL